MMFAAALLTRAAVCIASASQPHVLDATYDTRTGECTTVEVDSDAYVREYVSEPTLGYSLCEALSSDVGTFFEYDSESGECLIADVNEDGSSDWDVYDVEDLEVDDYFDADGGRVITVAPVVIYGTVRL